jgi:hypothetical protein
MTSVYCNALQHGCHVSEEVAQSSSTDQKDTFKESDEFYGATTTHDRFQSQ